MSHYFENDKNLPINRRDITFRFLNVPYTFVSDDGVFSKETLDYGTMVMLETILKGQPVGKRVLDLGCGYGPVGILLSQYHPECEVVMSDVNERAVELAKLNLKRYRLPHQVVVSDGYDAMQTELFDTIITNPPIRTGKAVIYRLFEQAYDHLNPQGNLYVVIRKSHGAESAVKKIQSVFGNCEIIGKEKGYFILKSCKN